MKIDKIYASKASARLKEKMVSDEKLPQLTAEIDSYFKARQRHSISSTKWEMILIYLFRATGMGMRDGDEGRS